MVAPIPVTPRCFRCNGTRIERVNYRISPDRTYITDWCNDCDKTARDQHKWIRKDLAGPVLRTINSQYATVPCSVVGCPNDADDLHHFAPRHIFPKLADLYPVLPLCAQHHILWHEEMAWHNIDSCAYCRKNRDKVNSRLRKNYE